MIDRHVGATWAFLEENTTNISRWPANNRVHRDEIDHDEHDHRVIVYTPIVTTLEIGQLWPSQGTVNPRMTANKRLGPLNLPTSYPYYSSKTMLTIIICCEQEIRRPLKIVAWIMDEWYKAVFLPITMIKSINCPQAPEVHLDKRPADAAEPIPIIKRQRRGGWVSFPVKMGGEHRWWRCLKVCR